MMLGAGGRVVIREPRGGRTAGGCFDDDSRFNLTAGSRLDRRLSAAAGSGPSCDRTRRESGGENGNPKL